MRIHPGLIAANGKLPRGAVAIGNFDGVHLGHRALLAHSREKVDRSSLQGPVAALTFEPHPASVLAPPFAPRRIGTPERKVELLAAAGADEVVVQPFSAGFASLSPEAFVELLCATQISHVVVGHDFTYGRGRSGNTDSLRRALEERGVSLTLVPTVTVGGLVVSSTKVREFVLEGHVDGAAALLGRPFDLDGEVVRGEGRGRLLGFPTANLKSEQDLLPSLGVYAVRVRLFDGQALGPLLPGAANLGINPTFRTAAQAGTLQGGRTPLLLEVHLIDWSGDLYGRRARVEFVRKLRDERRFPGVEALKAQIGADVAEARQLLAG
jgi:riboflavin kinase / FMN adenylyltransferase